MSQLTLPSLSPRTHFWLRALGLGIILALQFGPLLWRGTPAPRMEVASDAR
ncbi:MAG: hypothetical protein ACREJ3_09630 [Polyangiaceae bacterium]